MINIDETSQSIYNIDDISDYNIAMSRYYLDDVININDNTKEIKINLKSETTLFEIIDNIQE